MNDSLSKKLINNYQGGFPLTTHPFAIIAKQLSLAQVNIDKIKVNETQVIETLSHLLETGMLSRFGPLYDVAKLGGAFSLSAMQVPEDQFEKVTNTLNKIPEIAHNYRREHKLNMWFVIASDKPESIQITLQLIEKQTGLTVYDFPKIQEFYVGLWLELDDKGNVSTKAVPPKKTNISYHADELDKKIIKVTQSGLPLVNEPYQAIALELGLTEKKLLSRLNHMYDSSVIRRVGVVPNHYKLGLMSNGMSVWNVPENKVTELGEKIGALDFVSHCYERPRHLPLWPYNLFAMVHGQTKDEVHQKVALITEILGDSCDEYDVLFSSRILKKTGMRLVA